LRFWETLYTGQRARHRYVHAGKFKIALVGCLEKDPQLRQQEELPSDLYDTLGNFKRNLESE
jgi:hypothetical protein